MSKVLGRTADKLLVTKGGGTMSKVYQYEDIKSSGLFLNAENQMKKAKTIKGVMGKYNQFVRTINGQKTLDNEYKVRLIQRLTVSFTRVCEDKFPFWGAGRRYR